MTNKKPGIESQSKKQEKLEPSGLDSVWIDRFNTSWRVDGHEGAMEIVFSKHDLAAIALAGSGTHNAHFIPQVAIRMTLPQALSLSLALLSNFRQMNVADVERFGIRVSDLPTIKPK